MLIDISIKLINFKLYWKLLNSFHIADFAMVVATLLLTIFMSLTTGIIVGLGIAVVMFFTRFYNATEANSLERKGSTVSMNLGGAIYFGNGRKTSLDLESTDAERLEIEFSKKTLFDSSGVEALKDVKKLNPNIPVILKGVTPALQKGLDALGATDMFTYE